MKELLLIRHAKSSWKTDLADPERPLAPRGERAAPEMGRRLYRAAAVPQRIVTSDAVRAYATAVAIARAVGLDGAAIVADARLYAAGTEDILACVRGFDDRLERVALVGHNPALQEAVERLSGRRLEKLPTAAVVRIRFAVERWAEVDAGAGDCVAFDYPKRPAD